MAPSDTKPKVPKPLTLNTKITHLRLPLAPLISLSHGTTHPAFPKTFLHFWLLTEDELDDMMRFYDQAAPNRNVFSSCYPVPVEYDLEYLERRPASSSSSLATSTATSASSTTSSGVDLPSVLGKRQRSRPTELASAPPSPALVSGSSPDEEELHLSDHDRLAIKRRKFGKFIGIRGCETPREEVLLRLRFMQRRIRQSVEAEMRVQEEAERGWMGRKWV
ncbi:hypothetical protein H2201_000532 [Coniosporium apollinis]|uniref:Uncharacterized protein n=2 Tax=Coniosporium TaxID=2810619 RepID=A0ABQ9P3K9_9PEZI|nr:hypothetical protein H2199_001201 [Cladosporium sp. JES 115]KAJ9669181.1 hypothetical protein H2201_000532 [Coniosporium apollinis]